MVRSLMRGVCGWFGGKCSVRVLQGMVAAWLCAAAAPAWAYPTFTLQSAISISNAYYVASGDMDGDGDKDVVGLDGSGNLVFWANNGTGTSWTSTSIQPNNSGSGGYYYNGVTIFIFDMDNDGDQDVVGAAWQSVPNTYAELNWWENNGTGTSWTRRLIDVGSATFGIVGQWVEPADIDADGDIDVAALVNGQIAWYERNGASFTRHLVGAADPGVKCVHPVSLNAGGAGAKVLVTCCYYMGRVKLYTTGGAVSILDSSHGQAWSACSFDFDGDGDKDLAVTGGNAVKFWKNNSGTLSLQQTVTGSVGYGLAFGDLDGDGDIDAAGGFDFSWFANNGTGTSWTKTDVSTTTGSPAKAVADFDGDGDLDVVRSNAYSGGPGIGWYKNN